MSRMEASLSGCAGNAIDLRHLHRQAKTSCVDATRLRLATSWCSSSGSSGRSQAVSWLTKAYEQHKYHDRWLHSTIRLLDRTFAALGPEAPLSLRDKTLGLWVLSAALVALKLSEAEAVFDLGVRDLVLEQLARSSPWFRIEALSAEGQRQLWNQLIAKEMQMLRALKFRTSPPTAMEVAERITSGAVRSAPLADTDSVAPQLENVREVASFLIELATAHSVDVCYGEAGTTTQLAVVATVLAAKSLELSVEVRQLLEEEHLQLQECMDDPDAQKNMAAACRGLYKLWKRPPIGSKVVAKWYARRGAVPQAPAACPSLDGTEEATASPNEFEDMDIPLSQESVAAKSEVSTDVDSTDRLFMSPVKPAAASSSTDAMDAAAEASALEPRFWTPEPSESASLPARLKRDSPDGGSGEPFLPKAKCSRRLQQPQQQQEPAEAAIVVKAAVASTQHALVAAEPPAAPTRPLVFCTAARKKMQGSVDPTSERRNIVRMDGKFFEENGRFVIAGVWRLANEKAVHDPLKGGLAFKWTSDGRYNPEVGPPSGRFTGIR
eukprot:TRINITY_DN12086_c0_g1_i1.p1 TRINITY_DN12086_c0_g1~~TRINITY_DN12086_c0_g1_i1.p1  ORF type:complete len:585 (-),score=123.21 TRINITY_DN12086_c0_g1_i1:785-2437(-)